MQALPGFRDFLPEDCARRNYIFAHWREVARRYGFVEWEGPPLEATELYKKKSGDEIVEQLFNFTDKGEREVAMRPELTPTLARVVAAHEREFKKPLKWFSIGQFFRYEKQQRGRLREHFQLNCDIIGETALSADAELIALAIDTMRAFGFGSNDFAVRISDRSAWSRFIIENNVGVERTAEFLQIVDKLDRFRVDELEVKLKPFGVSIAKLNNFLASGNIEMAKGLGEELARRGLSAFVEFDLHVVRGLAYYTGVVFEVFDQQKKFRAIAGGGRYDNLIAQLSDGAVSMPALGFAMGDVVLGELIHDHKEAREKMQRAIAATHKIDIYVVVAKEERRGDALTQIQQLRERGYGVAYPLTPTKVPKQFQTAEDLGATIAILYGDEWPQVKVKNLPTREESLIDHGALLDSVTKFFNVPGSV
jgi:histidyl-tRNA synthetase